MLLGLISDTHGLLRPEVFTAFDGVDHILHAGDVGDPDILIELGAIAPVTAVCGNTDDSRIRGQLTEQAELSLDGLSIVVVHGHKLQAAKATVVASAFPAADLVLFGHSHRPEILYQRRRAVVNPGSAGPGRFNLPVTVALAETGGERPIVRLVHLLNR